MPRPGTLLLLLQVAAFWPVWSWYARRMTDGVDEPYGVLALLAFVGVAIIEHRAARAPERSLVPSALITLLYAVSYGVLPPLLRATLALTAITLTIHAVGARRVTPIALLGLALLSLPIVSSLQFYAGYPLRAAVTEVAAVMLGGVGYPVAAEGATLRLGTASIVVDAPCSGVRMLWSAGFLVFLLACLRRAPPGRLLLVGAAAAALVLLMNGVRAASLFLLETRPIPFDVGHDAVGVASFLLVAAPIAWLLGRPVRRTTCAIG